MRRMVHNVIDVLRVPDPTRTRYFIASPYKTATTTVGQALMALGAGRREMRFRRGFLGKHARPLRLLGQSVPEDIPARDWIAANTEEASTAMAPMMRRLMLFDVFSDAPFGHGHVHYFILKAAVPTARFIWINRPLYDWLDSVRAWELSHPDTYPDHAEWVENPSYRRRRLRRKRDKLYSDFSRLAQDYPEDCLEIDLEELQSWDTLAQFCDLPAPEGAPAMRNANLGRQDDEG